MLSKEEYNTYYQYYVDLSGTPELVMGLMNSGEEGIAFLESIPEEQLSSTYKEGKWTIAEVILHLIDTERIFGYRALCFSRGEQKELPGFEQDDYVAFSNAADFSKEELLEMYKAVRKQTVLMFKSFSKEMLVRKGIGSGSKMSTRAAGYIMIGHQKHHFEVIKKRYLQ